MEEKKEGEIIEIKRKPISSLQYWLIILLGFGMLFIMAYLVYGLFTNEAQLDLNCPIPLGDVGWCECKYSSLDPKELTRELEICYCHPKGVNISMIKQGINFELYNSSINFSFT